MFTPGAISPQQRLRTAHLQGVRRINAAQIPLWGLPPGWPGTRFTGNTEFQTGVTRDADGVHGEMHETIDLVHEDGARTLTVQSTDHPLPIDGNELLTLVGGEMRGAVLGDALTIRLDGHDVAFATAATADTVVARWAGYAATVTVTAIHWPLAFGLELVRVTDLAAYHEGRLRMLEQRSGFDLRG